VKRPVLVCLFDVPMMLQPLPPSSKFVVPRWVYNIYIYIYIYSNYCHFEILLVHEQGRVYVCKYMKYMRTLSFILKKKNPTKGSNTFISSSLAKGKGCSIDVLQYIHQHLADKTTHHRIQAEQSLYI
jgi:hypothetical protein